MYMQAQENIEMLRQQLIESLSASNLDYGDVLKLSSELARLDPEYVRFSIDAGHINRLGKELVARQETAVSELVKNAYDADAANVELTFKQVERPGGCLTIDDNGLGMTRQQLIDGFMRLSSTDKVHSPVSPVFKRHRAGRKGIGRFAAQRLGAKLTIITQTQEADTALRVEIDWNEFIGDRDLTSIASRVEKIRKTKHQGTTLIIDKLAEAWSDTAITRVYRYIADLIQPFPLSAAREASPTDPGFDTRMYRVSTGEPAIVASIDDMIYRYAVAQIEGSVDSSGMGSWSLEGQQLDIHEVGLPMGKEREQAHEPFTHLRNIHFKAYYYIYNAGYIPRSQNNMIRDLALERGGIRVYRNGFRVLPYGEQYNDWLRLDASTGRRAFLPPHGNLNFFGFVEIRDPKGTLFEETASREGLLENDAYDELVNFVYRVLLAAVLRIAEARERKLTASQGSWTKEQKTPRERIEDVVNKLNEVANEAEGSASDSGSDGPSVVLDQPDTQDFRELARELVDATAAQEQEQVTLLKELGMLRILAGLGQTIGEFTHEVNHLLPAVRADATYFLNLYAEDGQPRRRAQRLSSNLNTFRTYAAYFNNAVGQNARRELAPQELRDVVRAFVDIIKPAEEKYDLVIAEPLFEGFDLFTCSMHPSEWASILFNFFTNAKKAIRRANVRGKIFISAGRTKQNVFVEFADNGDGVAPEHETRIFDAFFTTTTPANPLEIDHEDIIGSGLGLKIVKDIVTSYNGDIMLVAPPQGYKTCFRIEFPAATSEELERYGY